MPNPDHLAKLKEGVEAWNRWRSERPDVGIDLSETDLTEANLRGMNLRAAGLFGTDLVAADLRGCVIEWADLRQANLSRAVLQGASLHGAALDHANLTGADLRRTELREAKLIGTELANADLSEARIGATTFEDTDLSEVKGLESIRHFGSSAVGIATVYRSRGKIPEPFLRGCGVPEDFIAYMKSLAANPVEFYSCFISYSNKDEPFAKELHTKLQAQNVRCWFAPEDLKIGDRFQERIEESIRLYDKLLVVLSENSINSAWVEREVQAAFEKEQRQGSTVLFPVRLDSAVMDCSRAWAADIRRTRHIGDFRRWKDHDSFQESLVRLLRDLKANDRGPK
jgi:hypothetical protein